MRPGAPSPGASRTHRPLRRYRESVCLVVAVCLDLVAWSVVRGGYASAPHGYRLLGLIGVAEAASLALLFWLQQTRFIRSPVPWIVIAWRMLPIWAVLELVIGYALAHSGR